MSKYHIEYRVECFPEEVSPRGNVVASGDDEYDKEVEDAVIEQLNQGNQWAWCTVFVIGMVHGLEEWDSLGCCSYESEEAFRMCDYFADMKANVSQALYDRLAEIQGVPLDTIQGWEHDVD